MQSISTSGWVPVAHLLRPQGRRGEVLAEPLTDLTETFSSSHDLFAAPVGTHTPHPNIQPTHIQEHWFPTGKNAGRIVLKLYGCDSISDAEALSGMQLLLPAHQLPTLAPDTFFVGDLIGCSLFDGEMPIGSITGVDFPTGPDGRTRLEDAAPLLIVQPILTAKLDGSENDSILIPFVRIWLDTVDVRARRITMRLPNGLLDFSNDPDSQ